MARAMSGSAGGSSRRSSARRSRPRPGRGRGSAVSWSRRHSWMLRAATPRGSKPCTSVRTSLHLLRGPAHARGDLVDVGAQVAVLVEVADDGLPMRRRAGVVGGEAQLLVRWSVERGDLVPAEVLERQVLALLRGDGRALVAVVVEDRGGQVEGQLVRRALAGRRRRLVGHRLGPAGAGGGSAVVVRGQRAPRLRRVGRTSSSSGILLELLLTTCSSSSVESCRSWIACCSSGVMTTRWSAVTRGAFHRHGGLA